ncbi:type II toxin-antitoxin system death-on-curing family toxin [Eggerthella sp. YY7918]|uniref:type II toxin-antitoxin system death-on-curing family toxin n=1 Tax=Eggerthella sp. (strain YY7918) TaxID=502558 RepID=UPI0002171595|nr:type II toxin-antitoxin system death-on-curing family toxin [Eggerthella sp. YY7918]BAK45471.1 hypothetical protein EGYY_24020 [Eggerthella sp. YY7918]
MKPLLPIPYEVVLRIHEDQIEKFGGMPGIRDEGLLESALAQPFASFGGVELYPSVVAKAARYGYGIIKNHPFADGNKRTGTALMFTFLRANGVRFKPRIEESYDVIITLAEGSMSYEELVSWIEAQI